MPADDPSEMKLRCVHCLEVLTEETRDHVFPRSWYPITTPPEVQRWTVPSCGKCNNRFGNLEKELFVRLALCLDPRKAEASGLSAKALRSMGVGVDGERISFGERERRKALKRRIKRLMRPHKPGTETFPGLGRHPGSPEQGQWEISFPQEMILEVSQKIVRGCEYKLAKRIIDESCELGVYFAHESDVAEQAAWVFEGPSAIKSHLGPGFAVTRSAAHDDPNTVIYKILVWGAVTIYASILPRDVPAPRQFER
jgi:hypothetical protein